ncbi:hypothetical protein M6B22_18950 [Jatrophihabitans cynanchi]|jgi:hypothetical protein|uniref:Uncharacterized protein n=1 Tax=Jatrophihabitans cynanchi TaxID=2944128 RepID=A0ABY7JZ22_9ACTN|nr:hypothetical protein [Jatrophihabitans sp. SB3-54]WAX56587.1 hypothetical protein M6B22_18950 [Jatrophihabitans sp. SB3-54]
MRTSSTRRTISLLAVVAVTGALAMTAAAPSNAATARAGNNLYVSFAGGDVIGSYDHTDTSDPNKRTNVDWTTTMFFKSNATINKVKGVLGSTYPDTGSTMRMYLNDGSGYAWDSDGGRKTPNGCNTIDKHIRLYADGDDRLYNPTDGYYVVGTTHYDYYESSGCGTYYGYSESVSNDIRTFFVGKGYSCAANAVGIGNSEPIRYDDGGSHIWQNDGNLHRCVIP